MTLSDEFGGYSINISPGRYTITVSYTGYQTRKEEAVVIAGKESIHDFELTPGQTILDAVEVVSGENDISGLHSLSIEKALRIPSNYLDPVRALTAYPGIVAVSDQNNSIIVRGNSPNGLLWRLNGLDIVNPNHLANAGTLSDRPAANGGGVNILSTQMLGRTALYAGQIPAEYGNALSGVIDMSMRDGNQQKFEYTAQASVIGLDVAAEGPVGRSGTPSFVANYRYSTVGLLSAAGIDFGDERIAFQDLSFNVTDEKTAGERVSLFGFFGNSKNRFDKKKATDWDEDKDRYNIDFDAHTYAVGATYERPSRYGKWQIGAAWSSTSQDRFGQVSDEIPHLQKTLVTDNYAATNALFSSKIGYDIAIGNQSMLRLGVMNNYISNKLEMLRAKACIICSSQEVYSVAGEMSGLLMQPFVSWSSQINKVVSFEMGTRFVYFTFNETKSIEPRLSFTFEGRGLSKWNVGYSLISQLQPFQVYLSPDNAKLGLTKSHHLDFTHRYILSESSTVKTGLFYQYLFDVPVERSSSAFAAINLLEAIPPGDLINNGTAKNVGLDVSIEKHFFENAYAIIGGSLYESKYKGSDNVERDTPFNGNFTINGVYGTEWNKPSRSRTIAINTRLLYLGGLRYSTIDVADSQLSGETSYSITNPYNQQLTDYFRLDFRISFRKDKPGYTRTLSFDIQNLLNTENEAYPYYDFTQERVVMKKHLGIIPVIVYRIDF